jgi:hypothetical protein
MARRKASPRVLVESFFEEYQLAWKKRYGKESPFIPNVRQQSRANELIHEHGYMSCTGAVREFVSDKDVWLSDHEHPMNYFLKYPVKFIGRHNGKDQERRRSKEEEARKAERERTDLEAFERSLGLERAGGSGGGEDVPELRGAGRKHGQGKGAR